jgi:LacI family transcriptional regulator
MRDSITITEIARRAGTSHPTVSNILNDRWQAKGISAGLAERVKMIAAEHNYRPNRLVRSLKSGRTETVSVMLPTISMTYFSSMAIGVEACARQHGYHVVISHVMRGLEEEIGEIEVLLERRVDGLILVPRYGEGNRANYRTLIRQGVPLVFLDSFFDDVPCTAVVGDDLQGGYLATRHLLDLGHRRIAHVTGRTEVSSTRLRQEGYAKAMQEAGIVLSPASIVAADATAIRELLSQPQRPTAVFACQDTAALEVIKAAGELGLDVPRDLSVVGYSDYVPFVEFNAVPLTTIRVDAEEMGRLAMQHLLAAIGGTKSGFNLVQLPAQLVRRASTATVAGSDS